MHDVLITAREAINAALRGDAEALWIAKLLLQSLQINTASGQSADVSTAHGQTTH